MFAVALISLVTAAKCPPAKTCKQWDCAMWCKCFDVAQEKRGVYRRAGCSEDGEGCDCNAQTGNKICYTAWFSKVFHNTHKCREMYSNGRTFNEVLRRDSFRDVDISNSNSKNSNELGRGWSGRGERTGHAILEMRLLAWWFDSDNTGKYVDNNRHEKDMEHLLGDYRGHTGCVATECRDTQGHCSRTLGKTSKGYDSTGRASRIDRDINSRVYVEMDAWEDDFGIRTNNGRPTSTTKISGPAAHWNKNAEKFLNCKHNDWHSQWANTRDNSRDFFTDDCRVSDKHRFQDLGRIVEMPKNHKIDISNKGHGVTFNVKWRFC